jgi:hypothetical protein
MSIINKKGFCYFGTLQIIHRIGMEGDILPNVFLRSGLNPSLVKMDEVVFIVHGFVDNSKGKIIEHSWIEFPGHVYDFTVGELGEVFTISEYREKYNPTNVIKFTRDQVFQILQYDRSVGFWGNVPQENFAIIYETIEPSTYSEENRDFLKEYDAIPDNILPN